MKWYPHNLYRMHLHDVKVLRDDPLGMYYPWVSQIANTFTRDEVAIGALNYMDLIQAGYIGLLEAWELVDHELSQAQIWTFIKKRIKWAIRRSIDKTGSFIARPINVQEGERNRLELADKILVNAFPKFFMEIEPGAYDDYSWEQEQLADLLDDLLYQYIPNAMHRHVLTASFGIDGDKKSYKELGNIYKKSPAYIATIKKRVIKQLKENTIFNEIIENFNKTTT